MFYKSIREPCSKQDLKKHFRSAVLVSSTAEAQGERERGGEGERERGGEGEGEREREGGRLAKRRGRLEKKDGAEEGG